MVLNTAGDQAIRRRWLRFLKDGPAIPDDLLVARDEGRVVFFCGAGVSRARAGLFDFFGLATDVIRRLGVPSDSPVHKILSEAQAIDKCTGVSGLISADRIFGLLEREFDPPTIEAAVAGALQPRTGVDLSAHRVLLDLATTQEGRVRLVTTNFDRLFDDCNDQLHIWQPPRLPDPSRQDEMNGIVHLHGRANASYDGAEKDGFVLSSSDFGNAYLAETWATEFFREIIDKYVVAFVGYTADDPPIQYLLEALNKKAGQLSGVYAFQAGTSDEAAARWRHKGIEAIAYAEANKHEALWTTLEAWAVRAKDPDAWYASVIDLARKGPECLQPHERGQVAHIVSTVGGARRFAEANPPPPADWLCVFDPLRRYAQPAHCGGFGERGPFVDPFDLYGLDFDPVPAKTDPENCYAKREVPRNAWDGFAANRLDRQNLGDECFAVVRGRWAENSPRLPSRLSQLGMWVASVADQPATLWWATHQVALHPDIRRRISLVLQNSRKDTSPVIRQAWRHLFAAWEEQRGECHREWRELRRRIAKDGWDYATIRKCFRPYLKAKNACSRSPRPPEQKEDTRLQDLIHLDVEYPNSSQHTKIPDEWVAVAVRELRKNLEHALYLENELGGMGLTNINPIVPDDVPDADGFTRTTGLSGAVLSFSSLFTRLVELDISAAREEFGTWPTNDDTIFCRLRIWATGMPELISAKVAGSIIARLSGNAFWDFYHQRNLLLVLARRWQQLSDTTRGRLEQRLLEGPPRWEVEEDAHFEERRARGSLNCIIWLANNGCGFTFDLATESEKLKAKAPDWKPEYEAKASASMERRSRGVRTDTAHDALLREPLSSILSKAFELSGRSDDFPVRNAPFAGLAAERPVRAFAALIEAAKRDEYPEWAWRTFLDSEARKTDKPKLSALIAERMARAPDEAVAEFIRPASDWLLSVSKTLASCFPQAFDNTVSKFADVLRPKPKPTTNKSALVCGSNEPDWIAAAGKIAQALFNDPRKDGLKPSGGFRSAWFAHVNELLSLPDDLRRRVLAILAYNLGWFYIIDSKWTEANLLSVLEGDNKYDRDAVLSGFLDGASVPNPKLYLRLKPCLLAATTDRDLSRRGYDAVLAEIILSGWGSQNEVMGGRCISNEEMRDILLRADDAFRSLVLWQAKRRSEEVKDTAGEQWSELLLELLRDVWPRQKSARTSEVSFRLCDLVFSNERQFSKFAEIILPFLTPIDNVDMILPPLHESNKNIADLYPRQTLAILYAVLPESATIWPYDIGATLERIGEADTSLKLDERLLELKRKWNTR